ncbi:hypothetical protein [Gracilinema caldarium]|uniref:Uncharacterized protein n=1 Tax=Gracilinema caldarium (strain ATCC 51460 / DSM 7334 / H1) TaxID=744872 RepID=F8F2Y3_GRAC1|nr:hypothetical protein [Gracilinema caldarium]AEJ19891.1 hypothetical protein Spica_1749 [Gracilinema caldarium DSM 7334]AEJ19912.1 hypothetical protein Spica_1770 [Gracilinema caldarium DSM 7334]
MSKLFKYIIIGVSLGLIDVIPMFIMKLTWDANISAFSMWVIISFILYYNNLKLNQIVKSIIVSFLVLLPNAILIGWNNPINLFPVIIMTLLLSTIMGFFTGRINGK